jgi:hypothetical protein
MAANPIVQGDFKPPISGWQTVSPELKSIILRDLKFPYTRMIKVNQTWVPS